MYGDKYKPKWQASLYCQLWQKYKLQGKDISRQQILHHTTLEEVMKN